MIYEKDSPEIPFVGMEPAVKPAAENTQTGVVGVLATPATFQGELYASVVERFADNVTLLQSTCTGLVQQIEQGALETKKPVQFLNLHYTPCWTRELIRLFWVYPLSLCYTSHPGDCWTGCSCNRPSPCGSAPGRTSAGFARDATKVRRVFYTSR